MTRRFILTTATLATFLTSGGLSAREPAATTTPPSSISQPLTAPALEPIFLTVGPHLAGLVSQERQGRFLIYRASIPTMNGLMAYLTENCCEGAACLPTESTHCPC